MTPILYCFIVRLLNTNSQEPTVLFSVNTLARDLKDQSTVWGAESENWRWSQVKQGLKISFDQGIPTLSHCDCSRVQRSPMKLDLNNDFDTVRFVPQKAEKLLKFNVQQLKQNETLSESSLEGVQALYIDLQTSSLWAHAGYEL